MSTYRDTGFYSTDSANYYTLQEAYPQSLGDLDAPCKGNQDCQDGLSCQTDSASGYQSCRLPPTVEEQCYRSHTDQRCHFVTDRGNKVMCKNAQCAPDPVAPPAPVDPVKCARAQLHRHQDSGSAFCGSINQQTGQFEQVPEKCCHTALGHMWDLEPDYVKFSMGPSLYGVKF
jgi:hypothetical protein